MAAEARGGTRPVDDGLSGDDPPAADAPRSASVEPGRPTDRDRRLDRLAVAVGAVAGATLVAVLAVPRLGADPLWLDEAYSLGVTNQFAYGVKRSGGTMFFYYALLWLWSLVSEAPAWLRLLSTLLAMATMWPVAAIGRRIGGRRVAMLAPPVLAGAYLFQAAALEARAYAFEILVVSVCWYLLIRAVEAGTDTPEAKPWWVALTLVAPWGVFLHGLFVLFLAAMVLMVLLGPKPRAGMQRMAPLLGATAVLLGLLAWMGVSSVGDWVKGTKFVYVKFTMYQYLGGYVWVRTLSMLAFVGLIAWVVVRRRRMARETTLPRNENENDADRSATVDVDRARLETETWLATVPLVWFLAPPILLLSISIIRPEFVDRYFVAVAPAAALTVALAASKAVDWIGARTGLDARAALAGFVVVGVVLTAGWAWSGQGNLDNRTVSHWDTIAKLIATEARPGDGILLYGDLSRPPFEAAWSRVPHHVVPDVVNAYRPLGQVRRFDFYLPGDAAAHRKLLDYDRIWAVNVGHGELPAAFYELKGPLPHDFHVVDTWHFADRRAPIIIRLYVRNGT